KANRERAQQMRAAAQRREEELRHEEAKAAETEAAARKARAEADEKAARAERLEMDSGAPQRRRGICVRSRSSNSARPTSSTRTSGRTATASAWIPTACRTTGMALPAGVSTLWVTGMGVTTPPLRSRRRPGSSPRHRWKI